MDRPDDSSRLRRILETIRTEYDPDYEFLSPGPLPWSPPPESLSELRVALVTTGGLHPRREAPFLTDTERFGDTSFRLVPHGTPPRGLDLRASSVDQRYAAKDPEVALPMRALERLHREGRVGRPAPRHASFCGGIVRPLPGLAESAAELAPLLRQDGAGAVVLLPTCSLCVQSVALLARELEADGFRTVTLTMLPELTRLVGAPRSLSVRFPFGAPCGDPLNRDLHRGVLLETLELLTACQKPGEIHASRLAWRRPAGGD
jgi:glycine/betaine/sarcosine/D-proline reductase family selenoprotein B